MTLFDIVLLLVVGVAMFQFWRIRSFSERANDYLQQYCDGQGLQLISVARLKTRIGVSKGKLDWKSQFQFEFSSTGEDQYIGVIDMIGSKVISTYTPPFRVH